MPGYYCSPHRMLQKLPLFSTQGRLARSVRHLTRCSRAGGALGQMNGTPRTTIPLRPLEKTEFGNETIGSTGVLESRVPKAMKGYSALVRGRVQCVPCGTGHPIRQCRIAVATAATQCELSTVAAVVMTPARYFSSAASGGGSGGQKPFHPPHSESQQSESPRGNEPDRFDPLRSSFFRTRSSADATEQARAGATSSAPSSSTFSASSSSSSPTSLQYFDLEDIDADRLTHDYWNTATDNEEDGYLDLFDNPYADFDRLSQTFLEEFAPDEWAGESAVYIDEADRALLDQEFV